jgi:hypothetical protein
VAEKAAAGSYHINVGGVVSFNRVIKGAEPTIMPFNAYLIPGFTVSATSLPLMIDGVQATKVGQYSIDPSNTNGAVYDLMGRRVYNPKKGIVYIKDGKKFVY